MNTSTITFSYLQSSSNILSVAEALELDQSDIAKAILDFMRTHPESSYNAKAFKKLSLELISKFLESNLDADIFAEKYGLRTIQFIKIVVLAIDDDNIIHSDVLADKIYRRLLRNRTSLGRYTPKRIIRMIASYYVKYKWVTQNSIATSYGLSRCSIGYLLKRGIEEKILSESLAEAVASKSCNKQNKYIHKIT